MRRAVGVEERRAASSLSTLAKETMTDRTVVVSLLAVLVVAVPCLAIGGAVIDQTWAEESLVQGAGDEAAASLGMILAANLPAAFFLYSGVVTLSLSSLGAIALVSLYIGATMSVGLHNAGAADLLLQTGLYLPFEFGGMLLAAIAGLYPTVHTIRSRMSTPARHDSLLTSYLTGVRRSALVLAAAIVLIVVGAIIESVVI